MENSHEDIQPPVEVPLDLLSQEALEGIIESFILREGTDYGLNEASHSTKLEQVRRQVARGDIKIVFDPNTETVGLMTVSEFSRAISK
jgi:hypothetical protein